MNKTFRKIVACVCYTSLVVIVLGLILGPIVCFGQILGRPASETYVTKKIDLHNTNAISHADIRSQVFAATTNVNALKIAASNATDAAHAAEVKADAAILMNTQQDTDIAGVSNSVANATAIANIANAMAQAAAVTNAQNSADIVTVSNLAVSAQSPASTLARIDAIETNYLPLIWGQTNNWRQAWTWGNHAAAGYLAATAWQSWLSTNTYVRAEVDQAALAAYAATNRVTILRDAGDASVWWVAHGGTNLTAYTLAMSWVVRNEALTVIEGENPPFAARSTPRPDIPYPLPAEGYWALDGEITIGTLDGWVSAWLPDTTAWGAAPFASSDHYTLIPISNELIGNIYLDYQSVTNLVGSYNLTTGNVWQAVSSVKQTAAEALLAADQAATLFNYHTTLDAAPHAGKFVTPVQMTNNTSHVLSQWYAADGSLTQQIVRAGTAIWTNRWPAGLAGAVTNGMAGVTLDGPRIINSLILSNGTARAELYHNGSQTVIDSKIGNIYFSFSGGLIAFVDSTGLNVNDNKVVGFGGNVDASIGKVGDKLVIQTKSLYGSGTLDLLIPSGNLCVSNDVCTAGKVKFGPTIDGVQAHLFSNGTNFFFVNVNYVTNSITTN